METAAQLATFISRQREIFASDEGTSMRTDRKSGVTEGAIAAILSVLGISFAAAAPIMASHTMFQTTPADEIGGALLAVALIILAIDRKT
jgi:xanthine/uracil permease